MSRWAFKDDQDVVLCCSSTFHRRFVDNLVNVMASPSGARIRFRYGDDICDPGVRKRGESDSNVMPGLAALIAHVKFEGGCAEFLPLRVGNIVEIKTEGSVTYLEIELGEFVEQPDGSRFTSILSELACLDLPHPLPAKPPEGYFCQHLKAPPALTGGSDTASWERVAEKFLSAIDKSNADFPFIFHVEVLHTRRLTTGVVPIRGGLLFAPAISRLELRIRTLAKRESFGSVIQNPIGTLTISVDHPECRLASAARLPIDTTRNLLTARITTLIGLRPAYGVLTITAQRGESRSRDRAEPGLSARSEQMKRSRAFMEQPGRSSTVDTIVVDLPIAVGNRWFRLGAAASIALAAAAHEFEIKEFDHNTELVCLKAVLVFIVVFAALLLGLKPQGGS
jgi:hypothetical protein